MFTYSEIELHQASEAHIREVVGFDLGPGHEPDDANVPGCDRPLGFSRRIPHACMVKLGLASGKARYVEALAYLIAEACLGAREGRCVSVSLNSNYWTGMQHVFGRASTLTFVREALKLGEAAGVLKLKKAPANPWAANGMQSTFALTPAGQERFVNPTFERRELISQSNLVRLRDCEKNYLPYTPDAFSRERFARLVPLNERLTAVAIGTRNASIRTHEDGLWIIPGGRTDRHGNVKDHAVRSDARILHATFNKGDWGQGGRTSGLFTMQLPKAQRKLIDLDGQPVELIDFSCSHPRIAYAQAGRPLEGDAYLIRGWENEREFVKRALNTALNAADARSALASIAFRLADPNARRGGRVRAGVKPEAWHWSKAAAVLEAITQRHDRIRQAFFTGKGLTFMRIEADVMLDTMTAAHRHDVTLLPTYDEFIVQRRHASLTRELMLENWRRHVGQDGVVK